jgi:hypothetical protein
MVVTLIYSIPDWLLCLAVIGLTVAFLAVAVWETAGKAEDVVEAEASEATDILRNSLTIVVTEEWRLQQGGAMSPPRADDAHGVRGPGIGATTPSAAR